MARTWLSWLGGCLLVSALGMVPPPQNVRMNSVNFKNILQWEPPAFAKGNLTYTAQFQSYNSFQDVCNSTALTECHFSSVSKYGYHIFRVRAEFADEYSDWINITFCPMDDTAIGPPGMQVKVLAESLHMSFFAPEVVGEHETWTMKSLYSSWVYNVQYWKNGTHKKFQLSTPYDFEVLRNLEPQTTYCLHVRGFLLEQNKSGEWSQPICETTTSDETLPSWVIAIILIASVFVVFLLLLSCFASMWYIYKKTKYAFAPGNSLPQHLKEFLSYPNHSTLLFYSLPPPDEKEVFDKLSVVAEDLPSSCSLRMSALRGSMEPGSEKETHSTSQSHLPVVTSASEGDQSAKQGPTLLVQSPALELSDTRPV
ncbi:interleukin-10 receptor subunit beta isoform X1 [Echinops telfairi]|uniref:Interleukin-10 receptor subunit beta isoform X1 n=3 Tax=Echinops telfairi TaxID=9371 RepID=A0AC55CKT2_ECHTE|nr:interleukin-10 receptor subunit beta isoform X1 [Echinops telfairi]